MTPQPLIDAVDAIWATEAAQVLRTPELLSLVKTCRGLYPAEVKGMVVDLALQHALQRLGFDNRVIGPAPANVPAALHKAIVAPSAVRRHLCPLDLAGDIPKMSFGPNRVCNFSSDELLAILDESAVEPRFRARFDAKRFAQFQWMVVEETYEVTRSLGSRYVPFLHQVWDQELGAIEPHPPAFAPAVEAALCCLLTEPWEDLVERPEQDWRAFRIPWVMTLDSDLFSPSIPVPDPDTLTWIPHYIHGDHGELIDEIEVPDNEGLVDEAKEVLANLNHRAWTQFVMSRACPWMAGPIAHFFVRAFTSHGVDEFLFHITTIEACLGQSSDHQGKKKPLPDGSYGATGRTAWRLSALLGDWDAGPTFKALFKERSQFVHGETMSMISADSRRSARSLARRCVRALIESPADVSSREAFLDSLLNRLPPS